MEAIEIHLANKLGWTLEECDRHLRPVMQKMAETTRQTRIESFFTTYEDRDLGGIVKSNRLKSVLKRKVGAVPGAELVAPAPKKKETGGKEKATKGKTPRAKTAWLFFSAAKRPKIKASNPDMPFGDVAKELARRWKEMGEGEKKEFEEMAVADRLRIAEEGKTAVAKRQVQEEEVLMGEEDEGDWSAASDSDE